MMLVLMLGLQPFQDARQPADPGAKRPKVYKTPAEILDSLQPPGCKIVLNHNDHRFSAAPTATKLGGQLIC